MENCDVVYIINGKKEREIIDNIISTNDLKACYSKNGETIFKNQDIIIVRNRKYNTVHILDKKQFELLEIITKELGK